MIPRYSLPEIAELFTDEARFGAWLDVEVLAVEAWAKIGVVPPEDARIVRERAGFDVAAVHKREQVTEHDVAAFVDVVQERVGPPAGAWVHYGLTSSDVVDTALALQMTRALDDDGRVVTSGGRVLTVTAVGADLTQARDRAYGAAADISWSGVHYRRDIGAQALP